MSQTRSNRCIAEIKCDILDKDAKPDQVLDEKEKSGEPELDHMDCHKLEDSHPQVKGCRRNGIKTKSTPKKTVATKQKKQHVGRTRPYSLRSRGDNNMYN